QLSRVSAPAIGIGPRPAQFDPDIVALGPAEFLEALLERRDKGLPFGIPLRTAARQEPDPTHLVGLLRACGERPRRCRAADERDELAALHFSVSRASNRKIALRETCCTAGFRRCLCRLWVIHVASARCGPSRRVRYATNIDQIGA